MLPGSLGDAGFQCALDCIPCQIVCALQKSSGEQCFGFPKTKFCNFLKSFRFMILPSTLAYTKIDYARLR